MKNVSSALIALTTIVMSLMAFGQAPCAWAGGIVNNPLAQGLAGWAADPGAWQKGIQAVGGKGDQLNKGKDLWDKADPLDSSDAGSEPSYDQPGMPEVPTACAENQACQSCYKQANKKIADLRYSFEKLRILYKQTDDFVKAAIAFGDGFAGMAQYGALQWTHERTRIQNSFKSFETAYRKKHKQLTDKLKDALEEVSQCEAQYFGDKDWYARYGFMFHSFIALHYQR